MLARQDNNAVGVKVVWTEFSDHTMLKIQQKEVMKFQRHRRPYYNQRPKDDQSSWQQVKATVKGASQKRQGPIDNVSAVWETRRRMVGPQSFTLLDSQGLEVPMNLYNDRIFKAARRNLDKTPEGR